MNEDSNSIIRAFLVGETTLTDIVGTDGVYCPKLPEDTSLPAVGFFTRGGDSTPYIPGLISPSVQFDCWAEDVTGKIGPIGAREVYSALYDVLQGIQREVVDVGGTDYIIWSAIEEMQGQDLQDVDIPTYFRVMTFFRFMIKAV